MNFENEYLQHNVIKQKKDIEKKELFAQTTVYINAGGRGTHLESIFPKCSTGITKALINFIDKPMVQSHIDLLSKFGFKNVVVGAGDHLDVKKYFEGKIDDKLDVASAEVCEGTGGDLIKAVRESNNFGENVLVENVDTILYVKSLDELLLWHKKNNAAATIVLTTRKGVPNEGAFFVDKDNRVIFSREADPTHELVEPEKWAGFRGSSTGVVVFNIDTLRSYNWQPGSNSLSIYRDIIPELIKSSNLYAYNNENNLFIDTGMPSRYHQAKRHEKKLFGAVGKRYDEQINK
jgi:NDP-sugar pyrophosphorylase family protein